MSVIKESIGAAAICMMVRGGTALVAQTGLLYHRRIADYEGDENWKRIFTAGVERISGYKWISDGKYYSSSSSMASVDMTLGVISDMVDLELAETIALQIGHDWKQEQE